MIDSLILVSLALGASSVQNPPPKPVQPPEVLDRHPIGDGRALWTFDVADLLPQVPPPVEGAQSRAEWSEHALQVRQPTIDLLTDVITREIQPQSASQEWSIRITPSGTLVLHATPPQFEWVRAFLLRNETREVFVSLETTWIEGPKGAFQRMGIPAGASATVIESKDRDRFLTLDRDDPRFAVLRRPRLSLHPLAVGTCSSCVQMAYVKSYKVETVQPGDVRIADPEIAYVDEGFELRSQAVLLDAQRVSLSLEALTTAVRRPIPTKSVRLAPDIPTEATIAMPEVERKSVQARCTLAADATVAFCAPCAGKDDREFLVLASACAKTAADLQKPR